MKRFIFSVLVVSIFFLGVGALVESTGAKFKSDEKALDLVRKARVAIGGDAAIANVQSMLIVGRTTQKVKINGVESTQDGETEIALQLPDKMSRMVKIGKDDGTGKALQMKQMDVVVVGDAKDKMKVTVNGEGQGAGVGGRTDHKIVIKKDDGTVQELTGEEAVKWIAKEHAGEAPGERTFVFKKADGSEVTGEAKVIARKIDGSDVTGEAKMIARKIDGAGGAGTATFTSKDGKTFDIVAHGGDMAAHHGAMKNNELLRTTLSLLLSSPKGIDVDYTFGGDGNVDGRACNVVVASFGGQSFKLFLDAASNLPVAVSYKGMSMPRVMTFNKDVPAPADGGKDVMFFKSAAGPGDLVDIQVKFSDYRAVNGVQLPFKWTQTDETFDVTNYEINPANIGERFKDQKVMVRTAKPDTK